MNPVPKTPSRTSPKSPSGVIVPHAPRWHQRLAAWLVFAAVRAVSATLRYSWTDRSGHFKGPSSAPVIFCTWHNRLALTTKDYYGFARKSRNTAGLVAVVSARHDGALLAAVIDC